MIESLLPEILFRQSILALEHAMKEAVAQGIIERGDPYPLKHYYTPIDSKYGCSTYAREIFIPQGQVVIGKIHKHAHLNFIMKGVAVVATEFGNDRLVAPLVFVSKPGTKRAVYAEEDVIWVTVHLISHPGPENLDPLDEMEDELVAKTYEDLEQFLVETRKLEESK